MGSHYKAKIQTNTFILVQRIIHKLKFISNATSVIMNYCKRQIPLEDICANFGTVSLVVIKYAQIQHVWR